MSEKLNLLLVQQHASAHLEGILKLFKAGALATVVVRVPGFPERDFLLTNDSLPEAIAAIERRANAAKEPHHD